MKNIKTFITKLQKYAFEKGQDVTIAFDEMLSFFISAFSVDSLAKHDFDYNGLFQEKKEENPVFFELMFIWINSMNEKILEDGSYDFLGTAYEYHIKSQGKAQAFQQYYTPEQVSDLCAKISTNPNDKVIGDCACGSGRLLLGAWKVCNKEKFHYFIGEDLDAQSVKMCALNLMINGMVGHVVCHDTLTEPLACRFGYAINEVRYPVPTQGYSIRLLDQEAFNLIHAKMTIEQALSSPLPAKKATKEPQQQKIPKQYNLFDGLY